MNFLKRQLPVMLALGFGIAFWLQFYIPTTWSQKALEVYQGSWTVIIVGAALVLGTLSAVHYHSSKIKNRKSGWAYSIITLSAFALTAFVGLVSKIGPWDVKWPGFVSSDPSGVDAVAVGDHSPLMWIFSYVFNPLDATMFALLAFFIAGAAFRAFRARSPEATLLLVAAILMMLGRVPIGQMIHVFPAVPALGADNGLTLADVSQWIFNVPNSAAQRGIMLGVWLSQIAIAMRIIFGIERTYMGGGEE